MLAVLLFFASASVWPATTTGWAPPPPPSDEYDWVQLTSGEWLKGEIKVMYQDTLEFDSKKLKLLKLDMDDVKSIRSARIMSVRAAGGKIATGKLLLEDGKVKVLAEGQPQEFPRSALLSVTSGVPKEANYWSGNVSVGGNISSGNSDQTTISAIASAKRQTVESRVALHYLGNYATANDVESANDHRANAVWDWFLSDRLFVRPVFAEYYSDPFQNIAQQVTLGAGVGYELIRTPKTNWNVFAGPAYQGTRFEGVPAGADQTQNSAALSAGTGFSTELSKNIAFNYDYRFQLTSEAAGRYNHHMIGAVKIDLTNNLNLNVSLIWDRISRPMTNANGTTPLPNDYQLVFGIGYDF
jgi:putative salt-induced outer membrane protein YdiY